jgi:hypothetical protein
MIKFKKIDPYRDPIMILNNIPYSTNTIRSKDDFEPSFTQKTKKIRGQFIFGIFKTIKPFKIKYYD